MSLRTFAMVVFVLIASTIATAAPQQLAEWRIDRTPDFTWGFATVTDRIDHVELRFGTNTVVQPGHALFENAVVTTSSTGTSFVANASNDPQFAGAVNLLTNGNTSDPVLRTTGLRSFGWSAGALTEQSWAASTGAPADFSGYEITSLELFINNFWFETPGTNPNGNGNWTDFKIDRRLRIFGQPVPEPACAGTGALLSAALLRRRRNGA